MRKDLKKLYDLLTPKERVQATGVVGIMLLSATLQVASAGSLFPFLHLVTNQEAVNSGLTGYVYDSLGFESYPNFLIATGLAVFALLVIANVAASFSHWARVRYEMQVRHNLAVRLLKQYLGRDYEFFLDQNTAELNKNILSEAGQVSKGLLSPVLSMFANGSTAAAMVLLMLYVDPLATLVMATVVGGGYAIAYGIIRARLKDLGRGYRDANRAQYQATAEAFGGIKDVKLLGRESRFLERFEPHSSTVAKTMASRNVYAALPKYVIEALAMGSLVAIVLAFIITGRPMGSIVPTMGVLVYAGYRMMPAFRSIFEAKASFRFTDAIFESIERALDLDNARTLGPEGEQVDPLSFESHIELRGVTYCYPSGSSPALEDISLTIQKNQAVGFVGQTGAGKTTIVDLILGLLNPTAGQLLVDDIEIHRANAHLWQANLGYVPQEIYLADTTIRRNIAYGLRGAEIDDEAVERAARTAQIHDFIAEELPDGYDTLVGENGVRLSGGQRQRLGIARALYHDPPVLVFDEATSSIDGATEAMITQAIEELHGRKTLIVIAHRFKTIEGCDTIHLIDQGSLVASGRYRELMDRDPRFQKLAGELAVGVDV